MSDSPDSVTAAGSPGAKRAAGAILDSDERFREVADSVPFLIWLADTDNKGIWYNKAWLDFTGRSLEQELGDGWLEGVHPDDRDRCAKVCGGAFDRREPFRLEFRMQRRDGEWRVIDDRAVPRFAEDGAFLGYIGSCIDVTERKQAEEALRDQADELQTILDAVPAAIWVARDPECMDISGNRRARELLKMPGDAQMSKSAPDAPSHFRLFGPDGTELEPERMPVQRAARGENVLGFEERIEFEDGSSVDLVGNAVPLADSAGKVRGAVAAFVDITDRKRAELALRESEERFRGLLSASNQVVYRHNADWSEMRQLSGGGFLADTDEPDPDWFGKYIHPDDQPHVRAAIDKAIRTRSPFELEHRVIREDGTLGWTYSRSIPILDEQGEIVEWFGAARDVSARHEAEDALRESEQRFRTVFEHAAVGMIEIDSEWRILGANAAYSRIAGRSEQELIGMDCLSFTHPDDVEPSREALRGLREGRSDRASIEKRYIRPDGRATWIRSNLSRVSGDRFLKIVEDIDDRKAAEEALRDERNRLDTLNRTGAAVSGELDLESVVQMVTDAGVELSGAEFGAFFYNVIDEGGEKYMLYTLSGADRSAFDKFPMPRNTAVFAPTFEGKGTVRSDDITKDPRYGRNAPNKGMPEGHLPVRSYLAVPVIGRSGEVVGGLFFGHHEAGRFTEEHERLLTGIAGQAAIAIDNARLYQALQQANETLEQRVEERTHELEKANEALRQAQKMEAIGQLTGGIAHDFNNMLTVIRGSADVLQRPGLDEQRRDKYVQAIADTADRAARLTAQLLAFARRQTLKPEVFDAAECVRNVSDILRTVLGSRIRLAVDDGGEECFVETDAAQFETALVNMAVNARDAMDGEGELKIAICRPGDVPNELRESNGSGFVAVSVTDSGHGIEPEIRDKIFEPFFTTKDTGKGTGLGLSQVYGFAKQSGGEVVVDSEPGRGTTFTLYLPHAPEGLPARESEPARPGKLPAGGRVLVVEDNEEVGEFAEQVLGELGFEARLAASADEALSILAEDGGFDLVFSDVVMPDVGGVDLAREIRERWPDLPVVLTSGYSHVLASRAEHEFPLLHKPYSLEALGEVLAAALARHGKPEPAKE